MGHVSWIRGSKWIVLKSKWEIFIFEGVYHKWKCTPQKGPIYVVLEQYEVEGTFTTKIQLACLLTFSMNK